MIYSPAQKQRDRGIGYPQAVGENPLDSAPPLPLLARALPLPLLARALEPERDPSSRQICHQTCLRLSWLGLTWKGGYSPTWNGQLEICAWIGEGIMPTYLWHGMGTSVTG
jgi:hypothetical protein